MTEKNSEDRKGKKKSTHCIIISVCKKNEYSVTNIEMSLSAEGFRAPCCFTQL